MRASASAVFAVALASSVLYVAPALAVPALLPIEGVLTDANGAPVFGEHTLHFALYQSASGGIALHEESVSVTIATTDKGRFLSALGSASALDLALFVGRDALFISVALDDEAEMTPRLALGTVPFAAVAREAETLAGLGPDDFVKVGDDIPFAAIAGLPAGLDDGDDVGVATTASLPLRVLDGVVSLAPCAGGQILKSAAGAWVCDDDVGSNGLGFTPGTGVSMNGSTLNVDPAVMQRRVQGACGLGSFVISVAVDGSLVCGVDQNTTYSVASPLVMNGTTIGMTAACSAGQVLKSGASGAWTCGNDTDTFPTAGAGLSLVGTTLSVSATVQNRVAGTCALGSSLRAIAADGTVTCELDDNTLPSAGTGVDVTGAVVSLEPDLVDGSRFDARFARRLTAGGYVVSSNLAPAAADILSGGTCADDAETLVTLPFAFTVFGVTSSNITVANNGVIVFDTPTVQEVSFTNTALPSSITRPALYAFWDDLTCDAAAGGELRFESKGAAGSRVFYVHQKATPLSCVGGALACNVEITVALSEGTNAIGVTYRSIGTDARARGNSATIGLQGPGGALAEVISLSRDAVALDAAAGRQFVSFAHP